MIYIYILYYNKFKINPYIYCIIHKYFYYIILFTGFVCRSLECLVIHQSAVHSQTFPTILCKPYLFCENIVTGDVPLNPSSSVFSVGKLPCQILALQDNNKIQILIMKYYNKKCIYAMTCNGKLYLYK